MVFNVLWDYYKEESAKIDERHRQSDNRRRNEENARRYDREEHERYEREHKRKGDYARKPHESDLDYWQRVFYVERERGDDACRTNRVSNTILLNYKMQYALSRAATYFILTNDHENEIMKDYLDHGMKYPIERFELVLHDLEERLSAQQDAQKIEKNSSEMIGVDNEGLLLGREHMYYDGDEKTGLNRLPTANYGKGSYLNKDAEKMLEVADDLLEQFREENEQHNQEVLSEHPEYLGR